MAARIIGATPGRLASSRRRLLPLKIRIDRTDPGRSLSAWCATCAREVEAGPVLLRGSTYCSHECALAATLPGIYLG